MNCANRDIDHLVECAAKLRDRRSFLHFDTQHLSLNTTGMSTTWSKERAATVGSRLSSHRQQRISWTCTTKHRSPCQCTATGECQWKRPWESASAPRQWCRRHRREGAHLALHNNGHVNDLVRELHLSSQQRACHHLIQELQLRNSTGCTVWTKLQSCTPNDDLPSTAPPHHNRRDPATAPPTCPFLTESQPTLALATKVPGSASTASKKAVSMTRPSWCR